MDNFEEENTEKESIWSKTSVEGRGGGEVGRWGGGEGWEGRGGG